MPLYISIAGLAYFYLSNKHTLGAVFGRDLTAPGALAERLAHMTEVVLGYVRKPSSPTAKAGSGGTPHAASIAKTTLRRPA
jgi:hypothetical protein